MFVYMEELQHGQGNSIQIPKNFVAIEEWEVLYIC